MCVRLDSGARKAGKDPWSRSILFSFVHNTNTRSDPPSCFVTNVHVSGIDNTGVCVPAWHVRTPIWSKNSWEWKHVKDQKAIMVSTKQLSSLFMLTILFLSFISSLSIGMYCVYCIFNWLLSCLS